MDAVPVVVPVMAPVSTSVMAPVSISVIENHENQWPTLSAKFAEIMSSEGGISSIRNNLTERANQSKRNKAEIDSMRVRGPVTLVLAGLRSVSRVLAIPLTALESTEDATAVVSGIETLGWSAKLAHSVVFLICMILVYVVYTSLMFTTVTDANTFVITTTMAWILCLWLILWLAL